MITHSAGGRFIDKAYVIGHLGKTLDAIITFTSAFTLDVVAEAQIPELARAHLGIHNSPDEDPVSGWVPDSLEKKLPNTVFALYDLWELEIGFASDVVFVKTQIGHYYQNSEFAKAYVTAFLGYHTKNVVEYGDIFKLGAPAGSLKMQIPDLLISQQHRYVSAFSFRRLCEFGTPGTFSFSYTGITQVIVGRGYMLNAWCPHSSHVAYVRYLRDATVRITINFAGVNLTGFKYITFRMGQVYAADLQFDARVAIGVAVGLNSTISPQTIVVREQHLGALNHSKHFKSAMQTYVIPLTSFVGVNLFYVKNIFFNLHPGAGSSPVGAVIIGSIEAWK